MGLVMSIISVCSSSDGRLCKFCYGEDGDESVWLHPCKCIGTLHWVHHECFSAWMSRASAQQQLQCQMCRHVYSKCWVLKPLRQWCFPKLDINGWQYVEMLLDAYSTFKFFRGLIATIEGTRSIFLQCFHFFFWRTFIMSDRRIAWYTATGRTLLSGIFSVNVQQYDPDNRYQLLNEDEIQLNEVLEDINLIR